MPYIQLGRRAAVTILAGIAVLAAGLYGLALDYVPIHLHHDEIYFGLFAHSIATTAHDPSGRLLPVLFQAGTTGNWYPPIIVYFTSAFVWAMGLSEVSVRIPNAVVGVVSVLLMYGVAKRLFDTNVMALAAAAMLAITPAMFINSRIATDCTYPILFILLWLLALARYDDRSDLRSLFLGTSLLGVGVYSYIAAAVMMPVYVLFTLALLAVRRDPWRAYLVAIGGAAWPTAFGLLFTAFHPELFGHYAAKYNLAQPGKHLDAFQQLREAFTLWNISDHLNLYHSAFAPGYLFVTGGSNLAHSTREAGVFLVPMAVFIVAGLYHVVTRPTRLLVISAAGFLTAPLASLIVPEEFAIPRMMPLVLFGVLMATAGIARTWGRTIARPRRLATAIAGGIPAIIGLSYFVYAFSTRGALSLSSLALVTCGVALALVGHLCHARRSWTPLIAGLLLLMPVQFGVFLMDYFGDYRVRSASRYEFNIRGGIEALIAARDSDPGAAMFLNDDVLFLRPYWDFYTIALGRRELSALPIMFDTTTELPRDATPGSLFLTDVNPRAMARFTASEFERAGAASDPTGDPAAPLHTTFMVWRKR